MTGILGLGGLRGILGSLLVRQLILFAGQSNVNGPAWADATGKVLPGLTEQQRSGIGGSFAPVKMRHKVSWTTADPPVWHCDSTGPLAGYTSSVGNPTGHTTNLLGVQQSCMRHLDYYRGNSWDVCTMGITATSLAVHWNPAGTYPTAQTNLFGQFLALGDAAAAAFGSTPAGFVWIQSESDGADATQAAAYAVNLAALFAAVRAHWPGIVIVMTSLSTANTNATFGATIRAAQIAVQAATQNCTLVNTDDLALMADHAHYTSDACAALGDRIGNALVGLLGLPSPVSWPIDSTMLVALPANNTHWQAVFAAANAAFGVGITSTGARSIYLCQEASGSLADSLGNHTMAAAGAGTITYRGNNSNWTTKQVIVPTGNTGHFENTDASLPDPATTSQARIGYSYLTAGAAAANVWGFGTAGFSTLQVTAAAPTFNAWETFDASATTSSVQITPGSQALGHVRNLTSGKIDGFVPLDHIQGNLGTVTGKRKTIGAGAAGLGSNRQFGYFYISDFVGSDGEFTVSQMRAIMKVMNWGNTNLGMPAITW